MRRSLAIVAALGVSACAHTPQSSCAERPGDRRAITETVEAMYGALARDDIAAFRRVTTDRFYSYDGGDRYDGAALAELIVDARSKGTEFHWSVGPLDTQIDCNVAWSAWENSGRVGIPPDVKPVRWLESAVLVRVGEGWKIDFFHSHRRSTN